MPTPIPDMGPGDLYLSTHKGMLYEVAGTPTNTLPAGQATALATAAAAIVPLDSSGNPSVTGDKVLASVSMSNGRIKFDEFMSDASDRADNLVLVNCAQTARDAGEWADPDSDVWATCNTRLAAKGVNRLQVQVIWLEQAIAGVSGDYAASQAALDAYFKSIIQNLASFFPNLQLVFISPRTYGGYTGSGNQEPYAYENGFAVRRLLWKQYTSAGSGGDADLQVGATSPVTEFDSGSIVTGAGTIPAMDWAVYDDGGDWKGAYFWADGLTPNSQGTTWESADFYDGLHPSASGAVKCSAMMLDFFTNSVYTTPWWYASIEPTLLDDTASNSAADNFDSGSFTPSPETLILIFFHSRAGVAETPNEPTASGHSITWAVEDRRVFATEGTPRSQVGVIRGVSGASPSADTINLDFDGQSQQVCNITVVEIVGAYTGGTAGSLGIVQSVGDSDDNVDPGPLQITLAAETNEALMLAAFANIIGASMNEKSGWSELVEVEPAGSPVGLMQIQWLAGYDSPAETTRAGAGPMHIGGLAVGVRLPPPKYLLEVMVSGQGTVTSSPAGIDCGDVCEYEFYEETEVTLTASPAFGWQFLSWQGDYDSEDGSTCIVTMDAAKEIEALFIIAPQAVEFTTAEYEIWLCEDNGRKLMPLDPVSFEYSLVVNDVGAFVVALPGTFDDSVLRVDQQLQFWRRHVGQSSPKLDQVGFLRKWRIETDDNGLSSVTLYGLDIQELLDRRIVAYAAGSNQAGINGAADNGLKDIFDENFLASATDASRELQSYGVTVQQDLGDGPTIEKGFAWRLVRTVMQEIAESSRTAGTELFFRIAWTAIDPANDQVQLQFQTFVGQPGRDLTWDTGGNGIIFGLEWGNLVNPVLIVDHSSEVNYVYALGQGEGSDRLVVEVSDVARIAQSIWNRREGAVDCRNETTTAAVTDRGEAYLAEKRARERFSGQLLDTPQTPYGSGWRLGDKVSVTYRQRQFNEIIRTIHVAVKESREIIRASFDGGQMIDNPVIESMIREITVARVEMEFASKLEDTKYKGTSSSDFTTATLAREGDWGAQTTTNQIQWNFNGAIRKVATTL